MAVGIAPSSEPTPVSSFGKEQIEQELAGQKDEEVQERGRRLAMGRSNMETLLGELEAEQEILQTEKNETLATIDFMMKELHKLNISGANTVEPVLTGGGGILDAMNRKWEKVRPRGAMVQVSEDGCIGELTKKPMAHEAAFWKVVIPADGVLNVRAAKDAESPIVTSKKPGEVFRGLDDGDWVALAGEPGFALKNAGEYTLLEHIDEPVQHLQERLKEGFGKLGLGDSTLLVPHMPFHADLTLSVPQAQETGQQVVQRISSGVTVVSQTLTGLNIGSFFMQTPKKEKKEKRHKKSKKDQHYGKEAEQAEEQAAEQADVAGAAAVSKQLVAAEADAIAAPPEVKNDDPVSAAEAPPKVEEAIPAVAPTSPSKVSEISSTLLIVAKLKLDDGSVHPLEVRAADRCKEVASRFIKEHSLKAWFQDPLTKYLKHVEEEASDLPVHVEAELADIRSRFTTVK